jgi:type IV pilus biogenesis protein CpaD/CtpE
MTLKILPLLLSLFLFTACTQYTETRMSAAKPQLSHSTIMEQIPFADIHDQSLSAVAVHYSKNGVSDLDLTMTYDPASKKFTSASAKHELGHIRDFLNGKGIRNIVSQTTAISNGMPSLLVSYDIVQAHAPQDCTPMPGLNGEGTTRFIDNYQFGCATQTMFAKQIAHPADLQGNADLGVRDGRREAGILDSYSAGIPREALGGIERDDLISE